jgi:hypothetical protein
MDTLQETLEEDSIDIITVTLNDPCDKCGMGGWLRALNGFGQDLVFCRHHGKIHEKALQEQGFSLYWNEQ